jgi:hypothetical protein
MKLHIARHTFGNLSGDKIQMLQKLYHHTSILTIIGCQLTLLIKKLTRRRRAWLESQEYSEQDYLRGQAPIQQSDQYLYDAPPSDRDYRAERLGPRALR